MADSAAFGLSGLKGFRLIGNSLDAKAHWILQVVVLGIGIQSQELLALEFRPAATGPCLVVIGGAIIRELGDIFAARRRGGIDRAWNHRCHFVPISAAGLTQPVRSIVRCAFVSSWHARSGRRMVNRELCPS